MCATATCAHSQDRIKQTFSIWLQLLHEFHLMDTDPLAQNAPKHDTRDLLATPEIFGDKLRQARNLDDTNKQPDRSPPEPSPIGLAGQAPHELVKFTLFKRGPEAAVNRV
jgi:hypothetical protein